MLQQRIEPGPDWQSLVIVRLLRRWCALRGAERPVLPGLLQFGSELGLAAEASVALASLFQLTESCLDRPLRTECCGRAEIGPDERAILMMLAHAPEPSLGTATREIPHGLPGALAWAIASARRLLGVPAPGPALVEGCPFRIDGAIRP